MCQMILLGTGVLEIEPRSSGRATSALNHSVVNKVAQSVAQFPCDKQHLTLLYSTAIEK